MGIAEIVLLAVVGDFALVVGIGKLLSADTRHQSQRLRDPALAAPAQTMAAQAGR